MTKAFVFLVGVSGLLIVSSLLLGAAIVCIVALSRWSRRNPVAGERSATSA